MSKINKFNEDISYLENTFKPNELEDSEEDYTLKEIITNTLTEQEKRILYLYAELASFAKVGKIIGVSATAVNKYINGIRLKLKDKI